MPSILKKLIIMLGLKSHKSHTFSVTWSLTVLYRGSETTQLQVTENLNFLAQCSRGQQTRSDVEGLILKII